MSGDLGFIHRFVPAEDPISADTLVVLHGTGGDENDLIGIGQAVAPGAAILSPRGNVLENGAPRFFRRVSEGVFDPKEVHSRAEELARFIRGATMKSTMMETKVNPIARLRFSAGSPPEETGRYATPATIKQQTAAKRSVNLVLAFGIRIKPVINAPAIAPTVLVA